MWRIGHPTLSSHSVQIYGVHTATTLMPIMGQIVAAGNWKLAAIYSPYFFVPLLLAIKMAAMPDPFPRASGGKKKRNKSH